MRAYRGWGSGGSADVSWRECGVRRRAQERLDRGGAYQCDELEKAPGGEDNTEKHGCGREAKQTSESKLDLEPKIGVVLPMRLAIIDSDEIAVGLKARLLPNDPPIDVATMLDQPFVRSKVIRLRPISRRDATIGLRCDASLGFAPAGQH